MASPFPLIAPYGAFGYERPRFDEIAAKNVASLGLVRRSLHLDTRSPDASFNMSGRGFTP